jgi:hypothetical protein
LDRFKKKDMWKEVNSISEGTNDDREKWLTQVEQNGQPQVSKICSSLQTEIAWRHGKFIGKMAMNSE